MKDTQLFLFDDFVGNVVQKPNSQKKDRLFNYDGFIKEKQTLLKTTDDCYTPDEVYNVVADWVAKEYNLDRANFVRPFFPGGDYENFAYTAESVVVDNPPFSILSNILKFYHKNNIKCFLFAPGLTCFSSSQIINYCAVCTFNQITFTNGVKVRISFITNLEEDIQVCTAPDLFKAIQNVQNQYKNKPLNKYSYPKELITAYQIGHLSKKGINIKIPKEKSIFVRKLDNLKNKTIYGSGFLISKEIARKINKIKLHEDELVVELSERERQLIKNL